MALKRCNYGADGVCNRCSGDSFSSGSGYCEENPPKILDRQVGMVPNPDYLPDDRETRKAKALAKLTAEERELLGL